MAMKLIRNIQLLFAVFVMTAVLGSCTDNNGDIGPYYGVWVLDRVTIDGTDAQILGKVKAVIREY